MKLFGCIQVIMYQGRSSRSIWLSSRRLLSAAVSSWAWASATTTSSFLFRLGWLMYFETIEQFLFVQTKNYQGKLFLAVPAMVLLVEADDSENEGHREYKWDSAFLSLSGVQFAGVYPTNAKTGHSKCWQPRLINCVNELAAISSVSSHFLENSLPTLEGVWGFSANCLKAAFQDASRAIEKPRFVEVLWIRCRKCESLQEQFGVTSTTDAQHRKQMQVCCLRRSNQKEKLDKDSYHF